MATKTESPMLDIEFYIETAETHGAESEPDHEVGDLQDFLRAAWGNARRRDGELRRLYRIAFVANFVL